MRDLRAKAIHPVGKWLIPPFQVTGGYWYAQTPSGVLVQLLPGNTLALVSPNDENDYWNDGAWLTPFQYYYYDSDSEAYFKCTEEIAREFFINNTWVTYRAEAGSTNLRQVFIDDCDGEWCEV